MSTSNFKGIVKLTEEQYEELSTNNTLTTSSGTTINYDPTSTLYITPDIPPELALINKDNQFTVGQTINGNLTVNGDIIQSGSSYETHAEEIYSTKDYIYLREGAVSGLTSGQYSGLEFINYDGTNNGRLVIDNTGTVRVGDVGEERPLAVRGESPIDGGIAIWNNDTKTFDTNNTYTYNNLVIKSDLEDYVPVSSTTPYGDNVTCIISNNLNSTGIEFTVNGSYYGTNTFGFLGTHNIAFGLSADSSAAGYNIGTDKTVFSKPVYVLNNSRWSGTVEVPTVSSNDQVVVKGDLTNYVDLSSNQTITGVKYFNKLLYQQGTITNLNSISHNYESSSVVTAGFLNGATNAPKSNDAGVVIQYQSSASHCTQIVIMNDEEASTWRRSYRNGTWTEWKQISGNNVDIGNCTLSYNSTNSALEFIFE